MAKQGIGSKESHLEAVRLAHRPHPAAQEQEIQVLAAVHLQLLAQQHLPTLVQLKTALLNIRDRKIFIRIKRDSPIDMDCPFRPSTNEALG